MDFHLSKEHLLVRKMYREFAENEVKPLAEELDEEERFPMETVEKMAKLGMMGIYFPKQYGGAGGDVLSYAMCVEELAKVCGTTAVIVSAHTSLCCAPIFENGTEEQKMKYLPDLLSGRKIGAFGLTEPAPVPMPPASRPPLSRTRTATTSSTAASASSPTVTLPPLSSCSP